MWASGYVWRERGLALHVCEGSRVASVPAQGNLFAAKCAITVRRFARVGIFTTELNLKHKIMDLLKILFEKRHPNSCKCAVSGWVSYDWNKLETRPTKYGKYFVHRKDGKTHWETWNGSGWAYNGNVITFWMEVLPPCH
jgi:hypothetical protein